MFMAITVYYQSFLLLVSQLSLQCLKFFFCGLLSLRYQALNVLVSLTKMAEDTWSIVMSTVDSFHFYGHLTDICLKLSLDVTNSL